MLPHCDSDSVCRGNAGHQRRESMLANPCWPTCPEPAGAVQADHCMEVNGNSNGTCSSISKNLITSAGQCPNELSRHRSAECGF